MKWDFRHHLLMQIEMLRGDLSHEELSTRLGDVTERCLAYETDNGGGNVFIFGIGPGAAEVGFGIAFEIKRCPKRLQVGSGQVAWTLYNQFKRSDIVDVVPHICGEAFKEVFGLARLAITARNCHDFVGMVRDRYIARRAVIAAPIKNRSDGRARRQPFGDLGGLGPRVLSHASSFDEMTSV